MVGVGMLKKLKKLVLSKPGQIDAGPTAVGSTSPLPPNETFSPDELPTIRLQAEEVYNCNNFATPRTCMTCAPLEACTGEPVSRADLLLSSRNGCSVCSFIREVCEQVADMDTIECVSTWMGRGGIFSLYIAKISSKNPDASGGPIDQTVFLALIGENTRPLFPWLPIIERSHFNRNQSRDIQTIASWLNDCQANHQQCQQIMNPKLPTRVIDVGSETVQPFLMISHNEAGRYLALSHRWGALDSKRNMLITKEENVEQFCLGIPFDSLPLTYKHSVEVARSLGIQYLWIDSLCIIQDNIHDWEIESARMGDIYENAYATLFAERASNSDDGIFQTVEDRNALTDWIREIDFRDPRTEEQHRILISWPSYYPNSVKEAFCVVDKPTSHLQNRGWVMQEEILSRRKICFSMTEIHWQCKSMSQCECGLVSVINTSSADDFTRNTLLKRRPDGSMTRALSASDSGRARGIRNANRAWKYLVEIYSQRDFTDQRDKLPALAGAALKLGRPPENYLAGIWREDLDDQLLWHGHNKEGLLCRRYEGYYCPTWSWASLQGKVIFCSFSSFTPIWRIVEATCQASGSNPMGLVSTGLLRIQSKVVPVLVDECVGKAPDQGQTEYHMLKYAGIYEKERDGKVYHLKVRADPELRKDPQVAVPDSILFLDTHEDWKLFAGKTKQRYYYLIAQRGSNRGSTIISEKFSHTIGLLIRESTSKPGYWERVCVLVPQGWWGDWCDLAEDKEILLI
ncbi:heterokaryon incompatibility protein-domain-containing protein [Xylogone sp. PMI_703]|nr:heterokaryon incompatibility protein-domain-containing protein [Xylogone sp. PMI_703]